METNYYVLTQGVDCDGYSSGHVFEFSSFEEANEFAYNATANGDGLYYQVTTDAGEVYSYCSHFRIQMPKSIFSE